MYTQLVQFKYARNTLVVAHPYDAIWQDIHHDGRNFFHEVVCFAPVLHQTLCLQKDQIC